MKLTKIIIAGLVGFGLLAWPAVSLAAAPQLQASANGNTIQLAVSGANSFSQVDFYARPSNGLLTTITNIGRTDQFGFFSGNVNPGLGNFNNQVDVYVIVNGQQSPTANVFPNGCTFNCAVGALQATPTAANLAPATSVTISFFPRTSQSIYIANYPDGGIANASLNGLTAFIYAVNNGSTSLRVCTFNQSECATIPISVSGNSNFGIVNFSQNDLNLTKGNSITVGVFSSTFNSSFYLSNNSNPFVASAYLSGNSLNVTGNNAGTARITICQSLGSANCNDLRVSVLDNTSLALSTSLSSQPVVGQFYSVQLQVSGGTYPYNFRMYSGSLPSGLSLSASGLLSGTPQNTQSFTFSVQVTDNASRSAIQTFTLTPSGGSVLGTTLYPNGTLLRESQAIFIVYRSRKNAFANFPAFRDLGYQAVNALQIDFDNLPLASFVIATANAQHPWGTWVKNGQTVYWVHESGLIPVPSWDIFINNGGPVAGIVQANSFDLRLPMQSLMILSDSRLQ